MSSFQGQSGHPRRSKTDFLTTSDHSYPRVGRLAVAESSGGAASAAEMIPAPLHEHCLVGFRRAVRDALADKSITDELRAGLIEGARTRFGWTPEEARALVAELTGSTS